MPIKPTYPRYIGPPLPKVLNPLNPQHYLIFLDWIFFKPSRLKQYLWQADQELYSASEFKAFRAALQTPAYGNLIWMAFIPILLFAFLVSLLLIFQGTADQIPKWIALIITSICLTTMVSSFKVMFYGLSGIALNLILIVEVLVISFFLLIIIILGSILGSNGRISIIIISIGFGIVINQLLGVLGIALGITLAIASFFQPDREILFIEIGTLRIISYILQIVPAILWTIFFSNSTKHIIHYPSWENELRILPLPGQKHWLSKLDKTTPEKKREIIRTLLRNPFQQWIVAYMFNQQLTNQNNPLSEFYQTLVSTDFDEYVIEPLNKSQFKNFSTVREIWLGEISNVFVKTDNAGLDIYALAWFVTRPLRDNSASPITSLSHLLLTLIDKEKISKSGISLKLFQDAIQAIHHLPHGEEISYSLNALMKMTQVKSLDTVITFQVLGIELEKLEEPILRPSIIEALRALGDIAMEIAYYQQSSNISIQAGALNRAIGMLNELMTHTEKINLPEQTLLELTIERWQRLLAEAAGKLGEQALHEMTPSERNTMIRRERQSTIWIHPIEPLFNPYNTGAPVMPPLFVGRQDIFARIQEIWKAKNNPDSIILYGHRRMGKSSILRNLEEYAPPNSLLIVADLKGDTAFVQNTNQLLRGLANRIYHTTKKRDLKIAQPLSSDYENVAEASQSFQNLLWDTLDKLPPESNLILALDEFEALIQAVNKGKVGQEIYNYLRTLSQEPRITMVFAGLHTLDEMSRDYSQPFFDSYVNIQVSFLSYESAERLIARPTPEFRLNYHPDVIRQIFHETHGQPLMIQRICQELVNQINYDLFDLKKEREIQILPEDLEIVLSDKFVLSMHYLSGIWSDQVEGQEYAASVMMSLANGAVTLNALTCSTGMPEKDVLITLHYLETRDLVEQQNGVWDLCIPLMRRWLKLKESQSTS